MSRQLTELENVLEHLIGEHRRMLGMLDAQQKAMKAMALDEIEACSHRQESSRLRIATLEARRQMLVQQLARLGRLSGSVTLAQVAQVFPQNGPKLLALRDELKGLVRQITERTNIAGKLASAVLGHLNTAVRLFAGAVGQAGTYTKNGVPRVTGRIGVMEAVG